jgi:hypothetical protein
MSNKICQKTNLDEIIKNTTTIAGGVTLENTQTCKLTDDRSVIAREDDHGTEGCEKVDSVYITPFGQECFPDGGLRAWLIVAGVRRNSASF